MSSPVPLPVAILVTVLAVVIGFTVIMLLSSDALGAEDGDAGANEPMEIPDAPPESDPKKPENNDPKPNEPIDIPPPPSIATSGPELDGKGGGADPLVVGDWWYNEVNTEKCKSNRAFDYDNDNKLENFCYEIIGDIFVIDWNDGEGITHGYNMLNFMRTQYEGMTPYEFLSKYSDICDYYDCYLWKDSLRNWEIDEEELTPYNIKITNYTSYEPDGIKIPLAVGGPDRYVYGIGTTHDGQTVYSLKPTYWMK